VAIEDTHDQRIALMDLAVERGLPLESVNSAAGWFLRQIEGWERELVPLRSGRAIILRPTPTLFLLLKIRRMAEPDLADCLALIDVAEAGSWPIDRARIVAALDACPLPTDRSPSGVRRCERGSRAERDSPTPPAATPLRRFSRHAVTPSGRYIAMPSGRARVRARS
jgi:hypothetical protein